MRLIDADTLKGCKIIQPYKGEMKDQAFVRIFEIDDIPTAFDRNKVVQQLEDYLFEKYCVEGDSEIERIVKGGGVDG